MTSVRTRCDTSEVDRDLYRISRGPNWRTHLRLDQVLIEQFQATQMAVHVVTGSLKASGLPHAHGEPGGGWTGSITYGGAILNFAPVPGPARNPGQYAIYEFEKPYDEGLDHNWMTGAHLESFEHRYADVIAEWMEEGL